MNEYRLIGIKRHPEYNLRCKWGMDYEQKEFLYRWDWDIAENEQDANDYLLNRVLIHPVENTLTTGDSGLFINKFGHPYENLISTLEEIIEAYTKPPLFSKDFGSFYSLLDLPRFPKHRVYDNDK